MPYIPDDPIHPSDILKEDFMSEYGLSLSQMARDIGVDVARLDLVMNDHGSIDADMALRLARYFGTSPEFWLNLQGSYDLAVAMKSGADIDSIRPVNAA